MTVHLLDTGVIELTGACPSEDAETLLQQLLLAPDAQVDWRSCESAHTAVIQVLLLARPRMLGAAAGPGLREWVQPLLGGGGGDG